MMISYIPVLLIILGYILQDAGSIRCYQCSSSDDKDNDNCGVYSKFDKDGNIAIDCQSDEAVTPGTFCAKFTQQSPRSFIWDGRWRQVIRRCASVSETGVTGVCNWGVYENGVYWEECYCSEDSCNSSTSIHIRSYLLILITIFTILISEGFT